MSLSRPDSSILDVRTFPFRILFEERVLLIKVTAAKTLKGPGIIYLREILDTKS